MTNPMIVLMVLAVTVLPAGNQARAATAETRHLNVADATGAMDEARVRKLAETSQELLERILSLWSAHAGTEKLGKIQVIVDAPRNEYYSSVFYFGQINGERRRIVRVFGTDPAPQMFAHKLTSAIFPQSDKLVRNMMGIFTETRIGSKLTFPMCGFSNDEWVQAYIRTKNYVSITALGPDHESWGMSDTGGGRLVTHNGALRHRAYAEAGSLGNFLIERYGARKMIELHRLSREHRRPFKDVFGMDLSEIENQWLAAMEYAAAANEDESVSRLAKLIVDAPYTVCLGARKMAAQGR